MADEKTEQPTPKRLRDARQKGQVAKSQEIPSAVSIMIVGLYFLALGPDIAKNLITLVTAPMKYLNEPYYQAMPKVSEVLFEESIRILIPLIGAVLLVVLISLLAQVGVLFAPEAAIPKMSNLSPAQWFKKVFALKNLFEFAKNLAKVIILSVTVYGIVKDSMRELFIIPDASIAALWSILGQSVIKLILTSAAIFCVIAALDFFFQKWQFTKNNMMSKDEVKREYKESEGDPMIKSKRKQLHQELLRQNNMNNVRKAKVLIVNPTHYAVALDYDKEKVPLPRIISKGEGALALQMIEIAKEAGVPIMRNVELARALYTEGTENSYIPREFIAPVAEVLRWVEGLK